MLSKRCYEYEIYTDRYIWYYFVCLAAPGKDYLLICIKYVRYMSLPVVHLDKCLPMVHTEIKKHEFWL